MGETCFVVVWRDAEHEATRPEIVFMDRSDAEEYVAGHHLASERLARTVEEVPWHGG